MAWARDFAGRNAIEQRLTRLVRRGIERARYVELAGYEGPKEPTPPAGNFDSLDYGLELDLDDGATWSFIWKIVDINIGLLVYPGSLAPTEIRSDAEIAVSDVTDHWRTRGPDEIASLNASLDASRDRVGVPRERRAGVERARVGPVPYHGHPDLAERSRGDRHARRARHGWQLPFCRQQRCGVLLNSRSSGSGRSHAGRRRRRFTLISATPRRRIAPGHDTFCGGPIAATAPGTRSLQVSAFGTHAGRVNPDRCAW